MDNLENTPAAPHLNAEWAARWNRWPALTVPAGRNLFEERQPCQGFPLVVQGQIKVYKSFPNGREVLLYHLLPGDACIASLASLFGGHPYQAGAVAQTEAVLRMMPPEHFLAEMEERPFRDPLLAQFAQRMAELMGLIDALFTHRLDQRLAAWLLSHGPQCRTTHQQLADELGTVREIITRLLRQFTLQGWVTLERGCIRIDAAQGLDGLRRLAQQNDRLG